jgi:hypothetical protein
MVPRSGREALGLNGCLKSEFQTDAAAPGVGPKPRSRDNRTGILPAVLASDRVICDSPSIPTRGRQFIKPSTRHVNLIARSADQYLIQRHEEGMSMVARLATIALGAACVFAFADHAQARSAYDGNWSVTVSGRSGTCQGGSYNYALQIVNGVVYYSGGDARISGRVNRSGAVYVRVSSGDRSAVGSGRLSRNVGGGTFRGYSPSGGCAGTWSGQRTGG